MLRNRKEDEALKLKGVNRVDEETDLELGEFEELRNFIPSKIYAFKKKRGVGSLNECSLADITTEAGDPILSEADFHLITELNNPCADSVLLTEGVNVLTTEDGDPIVTEF